jgi:hypothetical protein
MYSGISAANWYGAEDFEKEITMSVQKKSLLANKSAATKAIVAKTSPSIRPSVTAAVQPKVKAAVSAKVTAAARVAVRPTVKALVKPTLRIPG